MTEAIGTVIVVSVLAAGLTAFFALLSGRDFGSGFATGALVLFVISILSGQWHIALGLLIGVPAAAAIAVGIKSLKEKK